MLYGVFNKQKGSIMRNEQNTEQMMPLERTESLMLMSVLAQEPYRSQAVNELQRRRIVEVRSRWADLMMSCLGTV